MLWIFSSSNLHINNFKNKSVQTTLWGNTAQQIDDDFYKTNRDSFIVIVTSTIVKSYRDNDWLSHLSST